MYNPPGKILRSRGRRGAPPELHESGAAALAALVAWAHRDF